MRPATSYRVFNQQVPSVKRRGRQPRLRSLFSPISARPLSAKGHYHYACLKDYDTAVRYYDQARPLLPNSSRIPELLATSQGDGVSGIGASPISTKPSASTHVTSTGSSSTRRPMAPFVV